MPKENEYSTISAETFGISQTEYNLQVGPILRSGLTPSKAAWLETFTTGDLSFPLDADLRASIPRYLPGKVPESEAELYAELKQNRKQR